MAYDDAMYRRRDTGGADPVGAAARDEPRYGDPGYRTDPEPGGRTSQYSDTSQYSGTGRHSDTSQHSGTSQYSGRFVSDGLAGEPEPAEPARRRAVPAAALEDVFDDPAHGEPGRDRIAVHLLWELVLLAAAGVLVFLVNRDFPEAIRGEQLDGLLVFGAAVGLLTMGAGITLRTGAPNLALGPVAVAAGLHFAEQSDRGVVAAMVPAAVVVVALGLAVAVLVAGFHVPAWAASLAAALAVVVFIQQRTGPVEVQGGYDPTRHASYLFGGFAVASLLAGLFGTTKAIRRTVGRFRPVADPALRRGGVAATIVTLATIVSMLLAMLAGVLLAAGGTGPVPPTTGFEWTAVAIGAALLGGTSAFGRRGGIAGGLLAAVALSLFIRYADERDLDIALAAIGAVVVAAGLVVTRMVESYGRPRSALDPDEDWGTMSDSGTLSDWDPPRPVPPEPWTSPVPGQPAESRTDTWGAGRWGGPER